MQINKINGNWLKTFEITKKATMAKTAKVTFLFFDLQFCMTMPLRGW